MTPNEYRRKHKRCCTCIYWKYDSFGFESYNQCEVKNKETRYDSGKFCKVYQAKEFKDD